MQRMVETIRTIARDAAAQQWSSALGVVTSLHGGNGESAYACTLKLRETGIVLPRVPIATGLIGVAALPRENDLVLVVFAGGDPHAPFVVGRIYDEEVAPPENGPGQLVASLPGDETDASKALRLTVEAPGDGTRSLRLLLDGSVQVELLVDDGGVCVRAQDAEFRLSQSGASDGKAELKVGGSSIVVEQGGDVTVEAEGTLTLKAPKVEISGDASVKVAGQTIDLN